MKQLHKKAMEDKVLNVKVEENGFVNSVKMSIQMMEIAKEAGYTHIELDFVGADPEEVPPTEKTLIDDELERQRNYLVFLEQFENDTNE